MQDEAGAAGAVGDPKGDTRQLAAVGAADEAANPALLNIKMRHMILHFETAVGMLERGLPKLWLVIYCRFFLDGMRNKSSQATKSVVENSSFNILRITQRCTVFCHIGLLCA